MEFPGSSTTVHLFGAGLHRYTEVTSSVLSTAETNEYVFIPDEIFTVAAQSGKVTSAEAGKIFWIETSQRAQLAAVLTIARTAAWVAASSREYEAQAIGPFAACCRALVEATGDSCDALNRTALTIAENASMISRELSGQGQGAVSEELENLLIHFTHARKLKKDETVPALHSAKATAHYISVVTSMGLPNSAEFYGALCELMHPAAASMEHYYLPTDRGFRLTFDNEGDALERFVTEYQETLHGILPLALNPALLALRVCSSLGLGPTPRALTQMNFAPIPIWGRIAQGLKAAGLQA